MGASTLVIFGAGGFAREVRHVAKQMHEAYAGYELVDQAGEGEIIKRSSPVYAIIGVGSPALRRKIHEQLGVFPYMRWINVWHPSAEVGDVVIGVGNVLCSNVSLTCDIVIGNHNVFNLNCTVGHDCRIGDYCVVCPGAHLSGNVTLEDEVYVGTGAVLLEGVTVGKGAVIGAGSVVTEDVPAGVTVVGIPAKAMKKPRSKGKSS